MLGPVMEVHGEKRPEPHEKVRATPEFGLALPEKGLVNLALELMISDRRSEHPEKAMAKPYWG